MGKVIKFDFSTQKTARFSDSNKLKIKKINKKSKNWEKLKIFKTLLEDGVVFIQLNSTTNNTKVPKDFLENKHLILKFSYSYNIPDFYFDEHCISATLQFEKGFFFCEIYWESIFRINNYTWPES